MPCDNTRNDVRTRVQVTTEIARQPNTRDDKQLQRKTEKEEKQDTSRTGKANGRGEKEEEVQRLRSTLYADDAAIVSRSSEGMKRMMTVVVTA